MDDGESFLHIAPCTDEERVSIGMEPIIVHRSVTEVRASAYACVLAAVLAACVSVSDRPRDVRL